LLRWRRSYALKFRGHLRSSGSNYYHYHWAYGTCYSPNHQPPPQPANQHAHSTLHKSQYPSAGVRREKRAKPKCQVWILILRWSRQCPDVASITLVHHVPSAGYWLGGRVHL
jgi:hypothetical protein